MKEWFEMLDSTKKMVVNYLRDYPHTRDSDKELFFMILRDYYRAIPREQRSQPEESFLSDLYLLVKYAPEHRHLTKEHFVSSEKKEGRPMVDCYECKHDSIYTPIMGDMVGNRG